MITYHCKKMYGGKLSIRSPIVEYCIKMKEQLTIEFEGKKMIVKNLKDYTCDERPQIAQRSDKYMKRGDIYRLYDYTFIPEEDKPLDFTKDGMTKMYEAMKGFFKKKPEQTKIPIDICK
jgi:hypothetical protein